MISLPNIDLSSLANISVALATFILAMVTFRTLRFMEKQTTLIRAQTNILQRQGLMEQSKESPILEIDELRFVRNAIKLRLDNAGEGQALQLGIQSEVSPAAYGQVHGKMYSDFIPDTTPIYFRISGQQRRSFIPDFTNYISHGSKHPLRVKPGEFITMRRHLYFNVKYFKRNLLLRNKVIDYTTCSFGKLYPLLKSSNKRYFWFVFDIAYKNPVEDVQVRRLAEFIFDVNKHKTLEQAFKDQLNYTILKPIPNYDLETRIVGVESEIYNSKSSENHLPELDV